MTTQRWQSLMSSYKDSVLTTEEISAGWHWCPEFDGLLVGPGMAELRHCSCLPTGHSAYQTIPAEEKYSTVRNP